MARKRGKKKVSKKKTINKKASPGKKRYISSIVIDCLEADAEADSKSIIAKVKKVHPDSAIDVRHIAWYRHRFNRKLLPKQTDYVKPEKSARKKKASRKKISKKKASKKKKTSKKKTTKKKTNKKKTKRKAA